MSFLEPIVYLFAISNMYVYLLFAKVVLLDTIYSLKFWEAVFTAQFVP